MITNVKVLVYVPTHCEPVQVSFPAVATVSFPSALSHTPVLAKCEDHETWRVLLLALHEPVKPSMVMLGTHSSRRGTLVATRTEIVLLAHGYGLLWLTEVDMRKAGSVMFKVPANPEPQTTGEATPESCAALICTEFCW